MENNNHTTIYADIGIELLITLIEKLIHCAEKRELEIIYQFSKEVINAK
ncbi:MAG TPA: hypothetical protein PKB13_10110 [Clostridia bacterium]|nr:hypothetical protein [Clostridia bacterium]